jgi:hypothetical protein
MRIGILLCAAVAMAGFATGAAARTQVLEPTSDWTVDYGDEKCSLLRDFGPIEDDGLGLRIDSYGSLSSFQMSVVGDLVPRPTLKLPVMQIGFALPNDPEPREIRALTGTIGEHRFVQFGVAFLPPEPEPKPPQFVAARDVNEQAVAETATSRAPDPQFETTVNSLLLELRRGQEIRLNTGSMAPALRALRTCVDDLRKSWGLDPDQQRAIARFPYPDPESVKEVMGDFPRDLAVRGTNGFVPLRVMVDATGAARECVVQLTAAPEAFREAACANLGTRFEPALDRGGQPVGSFYQTSVIYLVRPF